MSKAASLQNSKEIFSIYEPQLGFVVSTANFSCRLR